jgi:hypothetical protein
MKTGSAKNENKRTGLARVACSVGVFLVLVVYLWGIQTSYDSVNVKNAPWLKLFLFALIIVGGGLSYDCAKAVGSLPEARFWVFFKQLGRTFLFAMLAVACCAICAGFANVFNPTSALFMYLAALVFVTLAIHSTYKLVEGPVDTIECDVADT